MGKTVDNTIFEVSHPEVWSLALRLCADRLKFTIHSDSDDNSLMFGELPFADTSCCYASCIEAAVYDNPFLLQSFGKTSVVTGSDRFLLVPDEMAGGDDDECQRYYDCIYPDAGATWRSTTSWRLDCRLFTESTATSNRF